MLNVCSKLECWKAHEEYTQTYSWIHTLGNSLAYRHNQHLVYRMIHVVVVVFAQMDFLAILFRLTQDTDDAIISF